MKKLIIICVVTILSITGNAVAGYAHHGFLYDGTTWTPIEPPGAGHSAVAGIDGNNLVGYYSNTDIDGRHYGFHYDMDTEEWTTLDAPEAGTSTVIHGIEGSNLVGHYHDSFNVVHGFLYNRDANEWHTHDKPGATATLVYEIQGSNLVGYYNDDIGHHGFLYNMDANGWTTYDKPEAVQTVILGIEGSSLVGYYDDSSGYAHGFRYDMDTEEWDTLDAPWAGVKHTFVRRMDDGKYVGFYSYYDYTPYNPMHGFVYDGTTWTTKDMPDAISTWIFGIDGSNLVGCYVPEPSTVFLLGIGTVTLLRKRRV